MTQRLNLIAQKQMLHKYTDQLDKVLAKFKEEQLAVLNIAVTEWQTTPDFLQRSLQRLVEGLSVLNSTKLKVEEELREFTNKLEQNLEPADILAEYQEMVEYPQQKILEAFEYSSILQARIDGFRLTSNAHRSVSQLKLLMIQQRLQSPNAWSYPQYLFQPSTVTYGNGIILGALQY
ncbi:hypothetical protein KIN20_015596 [Parelaphostrongylus tenuis]|uniref:Uncharacterized protein n=1 Tax=Parelaphostrongylus tenuis TaxID=148309 RepID=A0AAD5MYP7_PARTN|nr:hypothetical protein KIN20_015596 [Parelaphostrongylus tenuis]